MRQRTVSRAWSTGRNPGSVFTDTTGQLMPYFRKLCSHSPPRLPRPAGTSNCRGYSILNRATRGIAGRGKTRATNSGDCLQMEREALPEALLSRFEAGATRRWTVQLFPGKTELSRPRERLTKSSRDFEKSGAASATDRDAEAGSEAPLLARPQRNADPP